MPGVGLVVAITIYAAETDAERREVYALTYRVYLSEGYCEPNDACELRHYAHLDRMPETTIFLARRGGRLVGTNSLTLDGPAGLHVDGDFPEQMEEVRRECGQHQWTLAATWRIVTDPQYRNQITLLWELLGRTFCEAVEQGVDVLVASFHPKHERFYRRMVGARIIGEAECEAVAGKPAVLMRYDFVTEGMPTRWRSSGL